MKVKLLYKLNYYTIIIQMCQLLFSLNDNRIIRLSRQKQREREGGRGQ